MAGICGVFALLFLWFDRRRHDGFWLWQRRGLRRRGLRGRGTVLNSVDRGRVRVVNGRYIHRYDLVVEVTLDGAEPYRASVSHDAFVPNLTCREGDGVPVLVDPRARQRVLIDRAAIEDALDERRRRDQAAADEKRRQLLEND
ncbi:MAG TPA: hypothetical protein VMZ28_16870 [Kofleriaceae bacterium]|nr:hypothetical protein [Kofleriaceae bacterium]